MDFMDHDSYSTVMFRRVLHLTESSLPPVGGMTTAYALLSEFLLLQIHLQLSFGKMKILMQSKDSLKAYKTAKQRSQV